MNLPSFRFLPFPACQIAPFVASIGVRIPFVCLCSLRTIPACIGFGLAVRCLPYTSLPFRSPAQSQRSQGSRFAPQNGQTR